MVKVKFTVEGPLPTLIPLFSVMEITQAATDGNEDSNAIHIEGNLLVEREYLKRGTVAAFVSAATKGGNYFGRYSVPAFEDGEFAERAKFVSVNGHWTEIEVDEFGNFTFPDAGSVAELQDFAKRELESMRVFLAARDEVRRLLTPKDARYGDLLSTLHQKYGELIMSNPVFEAALRTRVSELHAQMLEEMTGYFLVEFLLDNLGEDGVGVVLAAAELQAETEE